MSQDARSGCRLLDQIITHTLKTKTLILQKKITSALEVYTNVALHYISEVSG